MSYKIRALLFDLDGVVIESTKQIHYEALNIALAEVDSKYIISEEEQKNQFEALSTKQKLQILSKTKNLPTQIHVYVSNRKQEITHKLLMSHVFNITRKDFFINLKKKGYLIGLCTNSISSTTKMILTMMNLLHVFDIILTNEDIKNPKPHPEIYITAAARLGCLVTECLVLEDSVHGVTAAEAAGCRVLTVTESESLYLGLLESILN